MGIVTWIWLWQEFHLRNTTADIKSNHFRYLRKEPSRYVLKPLNVADLKDKKPCHLIEPSELHLNLLILTGEPTSVKEEGLHRSLSLRCVSPRLLLPSYTIKSQTPTWNVLIPLRWKREERREKKEERGRKKRREREGKACMIPPSIFFLITDCVMIT